MGGRSASFSAGGGGVVGLQRAVCIWPDQNGAGWGTETTYIPYRMAAYRV